MKQHKQKITSILTAAILLSSLMTAGTIQQVFANKLNTTLVLSYDNPTPTDGDIVEIKGTVTTSDTFVPGPDPDHTAVNPVVTGTGLIQQGVDVDGNPVSDCLAVVDWLDLSSDTPVLGEFTYNLDTTGLGGQTLVFRAHYTTPPSEPHGPATTNGVCTPLTIGVACIGDLEIVAIDTTATSSTDFAYTIQVTACENIENLKIQGGSNGWSTTTIPNQNAGNPDIGSVTVKSLKRNFVSTWTIGSMAIGDVGNLTVDLTGKVACGKTVNLNGGWSVAYDIVGGATGLKSSYTAPLTFTQTPC